MAEQQPKKAGAQETSREAADHTGTAEQIAQRTGGICGLRGAGRNSLLICRERRLVQSDRAGAFGKTRAAG
jgi:hypothetical protein